jgi:hypothetical protein
VLNPSSSDSHSTVGQAMLATTWVCVGGYKLRWQHNFDNWKHVSQHFDLDRVFQNAVKAYRSSESKKQKALSAIASIGGLRWPFLSSVSGFPTHRISVSVNHRHPKPVVNAETAKKE